MLLHCRRSAGSGTHRWQLADLEPDSGHMRGDSQGASRSYQRSEVQSRGSLAGIRGQRYRCGGVGCAWRSRAVQTEGPHKRGHRCGEAVEHVCMCHHRCLECRHHESLNGQQAAHAVCAASAASACAALIADRQVSILAAVMCCMLHAVIF